MTLGYSITHEEWKRTFESPQNINSPTELVNSKDVRPSALNLYQNYPNPSNPSTEISYSIPEAGHVQLFVLDVLGREVETLVNEYKPAGQYMVTFKGANHPSGVYVYRLTADGKQLIRKMTVMK